MSPDDTSAERQTRRLLDVMATLRSPEGCPWDREQDHQTLRPQLIEECYELVEAIDELDDSLMREELGDVLLHIVFHSQMAAERGAFTFTDVARTVTDKLIRRHPHVFGSDKVCGSGEVLQKWDEIKKAEKPERTSALSGVPPQLPALAYSQEVQKKAAKVGFDWNEVPPVLDKIREEIDELQQAIDTREHIEEEFGDLIFSLVNLARHLKLDSEQAARLAARKFAHRFQQVETLAKAEGIDMKASPLEVLDRLWDRAKQSPPASPDSTQE